MNYSRIEIETTGAIGRIWLNRPEKRNALDRVLVEELRDAVEAFGNNNTVRVIVIAGRGPAFCAGADLEYLRSMAEFSVIENMEDSAALAATLKAIYASAKPTIARVHGPAIAGGCGLATVCDIVIASTEASFGYTEVRIGFIPAIVMAFLARKTAQTRVRELLLSGRVVDAREAYERGLVGTLVDGGAEALDAAVNAAAEAIAKASPSAVALTKNMLTSLDGMPLDSALDYAARMNALARMTPDCRAGIERFLTKS